jgi:hypothetical protein
MRRRLLRLAYWTQVEVRKGKKSVKRSGQSVHDEVLPAMGRTNRIFTEAPVPQADKSAAEIDDTHGYADLYKAKNTVGLEFTGDQKPKRMASHRSSRYRGERFDHIGTAAPTVRDESDAKPVITRLRTAPQLIVLGDLKPGIDSIEAAEAREQLGNYAHGFRLAAKELNEYARNNPQLVEPDGRGQRVWNPAVRNFRRTELEVPDYYTPGKARAQRSVPLVLVRATGYVDAEWSARHRVRGKLYVFADPSREGVWVYVFAPDQEIALGDLPQHVRDLGPEIAERLRRPLLAPPLARQIQRRIARRVLARKDPFDYDKWQRAHVDLSSRAEAAANDPGVQDAEAAAAIDEANAPLRKFGLRAPKVAEARLKGGREVREIKLWTGGSGKLLGKFRSIFGSVFTKLAELYLKVRNRITALLDPKTAKSGGFGGGLAGAALKAAYAVLKSVARYIVGKTAERLRASLAEGTANKLKALISDSVETLEGKLGDVKTLVEQLEAGMVDKVEAMAEGVIAKYQSIVAEIENVRKTVGDIVDIVNKVKWGARVIACLSPPGVGCLWILAQSVIEKAAARVVDTCWFKKKLAPIINKVPWVKELPGKLAEEIRKPIVGVLPAPLGDLFAKIDTSPVYAGESDICDANDDPERDALTAERRALFDLIEKVGEERFDALIDAMMAAGVRFNKRLTPTEIYRARDIIVNSRVTAEQLRHYAKYYAPFADKRKFGPLGEFLSGLVEMDTESPPVIMESEGGGGDGDGTPGEAITAVPSKGPAPAGEHKSFELVTFAKFGKNVREGEKLALDVTLRVQGKQVVLPRVAMVVTARITTPDGGIRIVVRPERDQAYELGNRPGLPTAISLSAKTSWFSRTWPPKSAKQPSAQPEPRATEPELAVP